MWLLMMAVGCRNMWQWTNIMYEERLKRPRPYEKLWVKGNALDISYNYKRGKPYIELAPTLRMIGAIPLLSPCAITACAVQYYCLCLSENTPICVRL